MDKHLYNTIADAVDRSQAQDEIVTVKIAAHEYAWTVTWLETLAVNEGLEFDSVDAGDGLTECWAYDSETEHAMVWRVHAQVI